MTMARVQIGDEVYPDVSDGVCESMAALALVSGQSRMLAALCEEQRTDIEAAEALLAEAQARVEQKDSAIAAAEQSRVEAEAEVSRLRALVRVRAWVDQEVNEPSEQRLEQAWSGGFWVGLFVGVVVSVVTCIATYERVFGT